MPFPSRLAEAVRLIGDLIGKMEIYRLFVFNLTVRLIRKWKGWAGFEIFHDNSGEIRENSTSGGPP